MTTATIEEPEVITTPQEMQLSKIVTDSGLQLNEGEQIKQSYLPFFQQLAEIKEQASKIDFENPTELDEKIARDLRLKAVKVRTGSEKIKEDRKRIHTLKANLEQSAWNLIKSTCELEEEKFAQVEKYRANIEKKRIQDLHEARSLEITPFAAFVPVGLQFGTMSDDDFAKLLSGAKFNHQAKVDADAKAEADRIEAARKEAEERERVRLENERLKKEAEEREAAIKAERAAAEKKLAEERAKAEAERLDAEKKAAEEKAKADAEKKAAEEKAKAEREAMEAKLAEEREAREKLEREAQAKAEAEAKAKREAEEKAAAEEKARIAAEKKAAKAPDNTKLRAWVSSMTIADITPTLAQVESKAAAEVILQKFAAFKAWAEQQITD